MNARASLPLIILAVPVLALALLWSQPPDAYAGGPTINVDETADELNVDGDCSLREAIKATRENAAVDACPAGHPAGPDQIVLESGVTYNLSIEGDGNDEGDLDVGGAASSPLTIRSEPGPANAVIDAGGIDRVIDIGGNDLTIDGITITGGNATTPGGGILNNGTLTLENSTVIDNQSTKYGGGIANQFDDSLTISDSVIAENSAGQEGGGISSIGPFVMTDSIVRDNTSQGNGGGLQLSEGGLITRSTVSGNTSAGFGGGIDNFSADLIVERSLISGNSAQQRGGGLHNGASTVEETVSMTNVTVTGNTAESGAGLNDQGEGITLVNVTVANNMVTADNQPNNLRSSHQGFYNLTNTLIADSTVSAAGATNTKNCLVTINSSLNSLDSDGTCELDELNGDIIGVNPLLGPLQDNGGATHTHALLQGSPAIDAGDDTACPAEDQRETVRPQGPGCDIGAYEATGTEPSPSVTPTPSPSPTLTPSPTPTQPPGYAGIWADNDCSGEPNPIDSLLTLRFDAGLSANTGTCPEMGEEVDVVNASLHLWGDVDCSEDPPDPIDSLKILRFDAGLSVAQAAGCPEMGEAITIQENP